MRFGARGGKIVDEPRLEMKIDLNVLEHLGLKMYHSLPAVVSEYVANAWDAGATRVDIDVPEGPVDKNYEITISDNGVGMSIEDINNKFLVVGRNRREDEGTDVIEVNGMKRRVMGRKGLGKIAGFGVAGVVNVFTRKDGRFVEFELDYDRMKKELSSTRGVTTSYSPKVIDYGETDQENGTEVRLRRLKRDRPVNIQILRRGLARRFGVIGNNFDVVVNGSPITVEERDIKSQCQYVWNFNETIDPEGKFRVTGWIGTMRNPVPSEIGRGIVVMTRGKLVQEPTTFDVGGKGITGQTALAYLVGEINAEFLDEEEDLVSTGRMSVVWEKYPASILRDWINEKIKRVAKEWVEKRKEEKMQKVQKLPVYQARISRLPRREKKIVDRFLGKMAGREEVKEETMEKIVDFIASSVEYKAFLDLVDELEGADIANPEEVLKLFKEWEVLDALELMRLAEGRLETIKKFKELVDSHAREVPTLHNFLVDNPWLLDPHWDYVDDEKRLSELLKREFPEEGVEELNRRIDFLCLGYGRTLNVVELKRPGSTIGRRELEQLERYVDFVKDQEGTDPIRRRTVVGYIIGGRISPKARRKAERLASHDMYVRTYEDLISAAEKTYEDFAEVFERKSRRTGDQRLREGVSRLKRKTEGDES